MPPDEALNVLWAFAVNTPPPILYHYTSMRGLLSIVETGRIRATYVRYLNDLSEVETMWGFTLKRLQERRDSAKSTEENTYLSEIISLIQSRRSPSEFVASFSEVGDDLSQWRSYFTEGAGFSNGFSSAALRSQWVSDPAGGKSSFVGAHLVKIRYLSYGLLSASCAKSIFYSKAKRFAALSRTRTRSPFGSDGKGRQKSHAVPNRRPIRG